MSSSSSSSSSTTATAAGGSTQVGATEIRKRVVRNALSFVLKSVLPVEAPRDPSKPRTIDTTAGSIITINTSALCLLHTHAKTKGGVGISSIPFFCASKDRDTVTIGRYIQRTMQPARELAFHIRLSDAEVSMVASGQELTEQTRPEPTTWTEFFIVLCPLDFVIGAGTRGAADGVAYNLNTAYKTNAKIIAYLSERTQDTECLDRVTRSYLQVGDYRLDVGVRTVVARTPTTTDFREDVVCQICMTRKSDFMDVLINLFCQVTRVYGSESQAAGHVFADELVMMNQRLLGLTSVASGAAASGAVAPHAAPGSGKRLVTDTKSMEDYNRPVHPRQRTLVLRASLDQLEDDAAADAFATAAKLFFERMRKQSGPSGGGGEDDSDPLAPKHADRVRGAIDSYQKALSHDGFVCGMVNVFVDNAHDVLVILDSYVHPAMARKLYVMDAVFATLRQVAADEGVARIVVLAPIRMNREIVLPLYDALVRGLRAQGAAPPRPPTVEYASAASVASPSSMTDQPSAAAPRLRSSASTIQHSYGTPVLAEWEL